MARILFESQDTLFFRDGRPFNQGESCAGLISLFPPSPFTLVGAARTAWARAMGWSGIGPWKKQLSAEQLQRLGGDGPELTGLTFRGPLLMHKEKSIFPAPACLIGTPAADDYPEQVSRLCPSEQGQRCDMGSNVRLPVPAKRDSVEGRKPLDGWWLNKKGFARVLAGNVPEPDSYIGTDSLWTSEPRVGISIDHTTGRAEESALYSIQHIRLHSGIELAIELDGNLQEFPKTALVPLGGEARFCWLRKQKDTDLGIPECGLETADSTHYAVHILTPLKSEQPPVAGKSFTGLPGKVISACLPRPQRWGGWDTINRCPLPMSPCLAPGSVIFMKVEHSDQLIEAKQFHGTTIGLQKSWGFGLIAIGQW